MSPRHYPWLICSFCCGDGDPPRAVQRQKFLCFALPGVGVVSTSMGGGALLRGCCTGRWGNTRVAAHL